MTWRVIPLEAHDAYTNMAIDEAIAEQVKKNAVLPTMRFYKWAPSAVSIGYFQSLGEEVNLEKCRSLGIDCVRRRTGGGAVYHDNKGEITYSIIAPERMFPKGIRESYRVICQWIIDGLGLIGIGAEFMPINDILVKGKKISGNAQTRRDGVLTQHGTILYDLDVRTMFSVLKVSNEKISDKMIKSVEDRVTRVLNYKKISQDDLYKALLNGFTRGKEYNIDSLTDVEQREAERLAREVYNTRAWNFMR